VESVFGKVGRAVVKPLPGTLSAYAERVMGGSYLDFDVDREEAARYGLGDGASADPIHWIDMRIPADALEARPWEHGSGPVRLKLEELRGSVTEVCAP
jgi:Cu/Ag efflux pump CusA